MPDKADMDSVTRTLYQNLVFDPECLDREEDHDDIRVNSTKANREALTCWIQDFLTRGRGHIGSQSHQESWSVNRFLGDMSLLTLICIRNLESGEREQAYETAKTVCEERGVKGSGMAADCCA